jgi:hypothetical protein
MSLSYLIYAANAIRAARQDPFDPPKPYTQMRPSQRYYLHRRIREHGDRVTVKAHSRTVMIDADLVDNMPDSLHTWLKRLTDAGYSVQQRIPQCKDINVN